MTWIKKRQTQRQNAFSKLIFLSHIIWRNFASCMHCEDFCKLLFRECSDSQTSKLHFQPTVVCEHNFALLFVKLSALGACLGGKRLELTLFWSILSPVLCKWRPSYVLPYPGPRGFFWNFSSGKREISRRVGRRFVLKWVQPQHTFTRRIGH